MSELHKSVHYIVRRMDGGFVAEQGAPEDDDRYYVSFESWQNSAAVLRAARNTACEYGIPAGGRTEVITWTDKPGCIYRHCLTVEGVRGHEVRDLVAAMRAHGLRDTSCCEHTADEVRNAGWAW